MKSTGAGLAELTAPMRRYPQVLMNVRVAWRFDPMTKPSVLAAVDAVQRQFEGRGRIVLRASGTEPVIRVMVEGYDAGLVKKGARDIAAAVEAVAAGDSEAGADGEATAGHPALDTDAPVDEAEPQTWAGLAVTGRRS
jgi:phosphoglucosamine mutase